VTRRNALLGLIASATAVAFIRYGSDAPSQAAHAEAPVPEAVPPPPPWPTLLPPPSPAARVLLPGGAVLSTLPGDGDLLALTLDDGVNTDVVRAYAQLAHDTGIRLTMFVTGVFGSWTDNRDLLLPLVESGQIQLGNHTWLHHDLTKMTGGQIADELRHTGQFISDTFGADATPYYRPPYGAYNDLVTSVAADLGYTATTMWDGNIGDDAILNPRDIIANAKKYYTAQNIVIGHLNHPPVTGVYHQLLDIISQGSLRTVTLNDVFVKPETSVLTSPYPG
jgi:peptidoglycan/xylan/chitin deacetylase (PgdA/CDA1 family)